MERKWKGQLSLLKRGRAASLIALKEPFKRYRSIAKYCMANDDA